VPMVGMAMGAGLVTRARQVAWTAGAAAGLTVGLVGLVVAIRPALWVSLFTSDPGVTAAATSYFAWAGPAFGFFGIGVCLYFSSQGAAKVGGPVLAGTIRLLLVGLGGWWLASSGAPAWTLFALVGAAMVVFGLATVPEVGWKIWVNQQRSEVEDEVRTILREATAPSQALPPLIKTDSATLSTVIENREVRNLPLDGRNFYELTLLVPGSAPAAQLDR